MKMRHFFLEFTEVDNRQYSALKAWLEDVSIVQVDGRGRIWAPLKKGETNPSAPRNIRAHFRYEEGKYVLANAVELVEASSRKEGDRSLWTVKLRFNSEFFHPSDETLNLDVLFSTPQNVLNGIYSILGAFAEV